ncbi:MAG: hypothetical protein K1X64_05475 [Myxococcaceae bacterium]|nr:hypothetical protein [Myxococcaceae bacterium]
MAIHVDAAQPALKLAAPHIARLAADRQHRRKTLAQLLAWNAATDGTTVNLEFIGGDIIRPCLVQLFVHWMRLQ